MPQHVGIAGREIGGAAERTQGVLEPAAGLGKHVAIQARRHPMLIHEGLPGRGAWAGEAQGPAALPLADEIDQAGLGIAVLRAQASGLADAAAGEGKESEGIGEGAVLDHREEALHFVGAEELDFFLALSVCDAGALDSGARIRPAGVAIDRGEPVQVLFDRFGAEATLAAPLALPGLLQEPVAPALDVPALDGAQTAGGAKEIN